MEITDIKYGPLSKDATTWLMHKNLWVMINLYKKYHMEQNIFIEASFNNNIHTWEKVFSAATFEGLRGVSFQTE